jgi:hypothetical protein
MGSDNTNTLESVQGWNHDSISASNVIEENIDYAYVFQINM